MGLAGFLKKMFGSRPVVDAGAARRSRPLRNPLVSICEAADGTARLEAPLEEVSRGLAKLAASRSQKPMVKAFELEPVGAFVWSLCDGRHTFEGIARQLRDRYKMNRMEAEAALASFLQTLAKKGLVSIDLPNKRR